MGSVLRFVRRGARCPSCGRPLSGPRLGAAGLSCRCAAGHGLMLIRGGLTDAPASVPRRNDEPADGALPDLLA